LLKKIVLKSCWEKLNQVVIDTGKAMHSGSEEEESVHGIFITAFLDAEL